jgi:DNA-binding response OmpR family regulator
MSLEVIQIIEDDHLQASLIDREVRKAGYRTNVAYDGKTGLDDVHRLRPSLVLLDVMLPGMDGHEVCRQLRADSGTEAIPIIMMSALGTEEHRTTGLQIGADDYVVKPFSLNELIARIQAQLRRTKQQADRRPVSRAGEVTLEDQEVSALFRGRRIALSGIEAVLLRRLAGTPGKIVLKEELIDLVWGRDGLIHEHELDRQITSLRRKLGDDPANPCIVVSTVTGYLFVPAQQETA